jgi:AraC family carnitine catabolism transcriptional activator
MSVLEVAVACGFESPSYFTRCYRARFERCPRQDRQVAGADYRPLNA